MNLRFSHFDNKITKDEIKDILEREFRRYAPFEVSVSFTSGNTTK